MRMRPSADPRAPGIYQTFDTVAPPPLVIANTRIAGFCGITQKGPMNEATRLSNWDEFQEIFGTGGDSYTVGSVVRIYDRENSDFIVISEVADKLIKWSVETPVNRRHRAAAPTHLEVMTFEIHVAMKDRREVFKGLQMHPSSRSYAPRVVSQRSRLVRLEDLGTKSPVPHNLPEAVAMTRLGGGRD